MSSTFSATAEVTTTLDGVWLHDPDDPTGTALNLLYGRSRRSGGVSVESADLQYAGRVFPVTDFGPYETEGVSVEVDVPASDAATLPALYALIRSRKPLYYRDNRGRAFLSVVPSASDRDEDHGSTVSFSASRRGA